MGLVVGEDIYQSVGMSLLEAPYLALLEVISLLRGAGGEEELALETVFYGAEQFLRW